MIVHDVAQGSADWWNLRLGVPTASAMDSIIKSSATWLCVHDGETVSRHTSQTTAESAAAKANKKLPGHSAISVFEPSSSAETYKHKLLAEWLMGIPIDDYQSKWMERGHELEPEAWAYYELQNDVDVVRGGFITDDAGTVGASPDGRVYDGEELVGGIELKCPAPQTHVGYMLKPESLATAYKHQTQGCILLTGARWWDLMSYHPMLPPVVVRVTPDGDAQYVESLRSAVFEFAQQVAELKHTLSHLRRGTTNGNES